MITIKTPHWRLEIPLHHTVPLIDLVNTALQAFPAQPGQTDAGNYFTATRMSKARLCEKRTHVKRCVESF